MIYHDLAVIEQKSAKVFERGSKAPVLLLRQACLIPLYKVWTLPGESFLMIFRTAVRLTSHKFGPKQIWYLEEMFESDVSEKNSLDRAIRYTYFISYNLCAVAFLMKIVLSLLR